MMLDEPDPVFLKRILAEIDAQTAARRSDAPDKVTIATADLERLVKLYAGVPATAFRIN
jgi:hypothetical protein